MQGRRRRKEEEGRRGDMVMGSCVSALRCRVKRVSKG